MMKRKRKGINGYFDGHQMRCSCGAPAILRSADGIYKHNPNGTMLYVCARYPACNTYVRTHAGTKQPVGTMAGPELRRLRNEAHRYFNQIYLSGIMSKQDAYAWLADVIGATKSHAHIGYLSEYYCKEVIAQSKRVLAARATIHPSAAEPSRKTIPFPTKAGDSA
ncbi:zinc-finger-containing protein [Bengtsoniella intestinalis]|uniref:zinc-finger-containing protein n=1 Tax=Bengtsoniella intestinalis TaxID=3073143 RepID=UPI00391FB9E5